MSRLSILYQMRQLFCGLILGGVVLADAASVEAASSWHQRLGKVKDVLASGDWQTARDRSMALRSKMIRKVRLAHELLPLAAQTLALQAIAEANLGKDRDAEWHWFAAQSFLGGIPPMDLADVGRAYELLADLSADQLPSGVTPLVAADPTMERYESVRIRRSVEPELPKALQRAGLAGTVTLDVVVDARGRLRRPRVIDAGPVPTMAFPVLDALQRWAFAPASQDAEPIAVLYQLRIEYR